MIKVCIIGAGKISEEYIKVLNNFKNTKVLGIISRTLKSCKEKSKKFNIPYYGNSIENIMSIVKPDIVIICVTPTETKKVCSKILNYKCHLLIEKPVGLNLKENKFILNIHNKNKNKMFVALNRRYFGTTINLLNELKKIRSKRVVNIFDQENTLAAIKNGHSKLVIKNWMFANSIHLIDFFSILCRGKIKKVIKEKKQLNRSEYYIIAKIEFSSGDLGIYHAYWNRPAPWKISVSCDKSFFYMSPIENLFKINIKREVINFRPNDIDKKYKPGFYLMIKDLINSFRNRKNKLVSVKKNLETMKLIDKLYS